MQQSLTDNFNHTLTRVVFQKKKKNNGNITRVRVSWQQTLLYHFNDSEVLLSKRKQASH